MIYFVSNQKPLSIQAEARNRNSYKDRLRNEFSAIASLYPFLPINKELYTKLIYIHSSKTDIDVDNMSKPFVDAFNGVIYTDDKIINHRICSKIKIQELSSYEIQISSFPNKIAAKLDELLKNRSQHILYFEVGILSHEMIFIGDSK